MGKGLTLSLSDSLSPSLSLTFSLSHSHSLSLLFNVISHRGPGAICSRCAFGEGLHRGRPNAEQVCAGAHTHTRKRTRTHTHTHSHLSHTQTRSKHSGSLAHLAAGWEGEGEQSAGVCGTASQRPSESDVLAIILATVWDLKREPKPYSHSTEASWQDQHRCCSFQ